MIAKECLGEWFKNDKKWTQQIENNLINKVIELGETMGRLTGGQKLNIPLTHYSVTHLYKKKQKI